MWKVQKVHNLVVNASRNLLLTPGEFMTVDEGMIRYKGWRCRWVRFNPKKPQAYGLKVWLLVDWETGIIVNFALDVGQYSQEEYMDIKWGSSGQVVLDLVRPWFNQWHTICTDNWFSSPALAKGAWSFSFISLYNIAHSR